MITKDPYATPTYANWQRYGYTDNRCTLKGGSEDYELASGYVLPSATDKVGWRRFDVRENARSVLSQYSFRVCRTVKEET